jgi:hypothetical protein
VIHTSRIRKEYEFERRRVGPSRTCLTLVFDRSSAAHRCVDRLLL